MVQVRQAVLIFVLASGLWGAAPGAVRQFLPDDPIDAMPQPLAVGKPVRQNVNENLDFVAQSRRSSPPPPRPAGAINTLGEVPDSEWFTQRHGKHRMNRAELQQGPPLGEPPVRPFTVISGKTAGITPGFRIQDSRGRRYFVKRDPVSNAEMATGSDAIVSNFLYAIGYNTPQNEIVDLKLSDLRLTPDAKITPSGEKSRQMTWRDVEQIVKEIPHYEDGSFRIVASLAVEGENIGPFRYEGIRGDDPNDIVPHEDRRDLRGLNVISAWLNNTDAKADNTLDTIVEKNGSRFIRHYLIDFGSSLGSDGDVPKDPRLGNEYMVGTAGATLWKVLNLGLWPESWERAHYPKLPAVGHFESQLFDPESWKPEYPNPAFIRHLPDDDYWAAKQVMAFTDDDIHAIVETARFTDPRSIEYITATLKERRNKIGRTYFSKILPLDRFRVENNALVFDDLAVLYGFHAPRPYSIRWHRFDNVSRTKIPIPGGESPALPLEAAQASPGMYFCAAIDSPGDSLKPVSVYLRKDKSNFKIVGIERSW